MFAHISHLLIRAWVVFLSWNSATTFSVIRDFLVALVVFVLMARLTQGKAWWRLSVLRSSGEQLLLTLLATIGGLLLVIGFVYVAAIPCAVYQDHIDLVRDNNMLIREKRKLIEEKAALQTTLEEERSRQSDPHSFEKRKLDHPIISSALATVTQRQPGKYELRVRLSNPTTFEARVHTTVIALWNGDVISGPHSKDLDFAPGDKIDISVDPTITSDQEAKFTKGAGRLGIHITAEYRDRRTMTVYEGLSAIRATGKLHDHPSHDHARIPLLCFSRPLIYWLVLHPTPG